ncbi:DUF2101 family protein [Candidatus Pacearchaeota archaeon]|nr:DUF2101 family protein [Candidatus Pacearchaeota archaeon]
MKKKWIVLLVVLGIILILIIGGIFLYREFCWKEYNLDEIEEIKKEITNIFVEADTKLVVYPGHRSIDIERGNKDKGIAFSIRNLGTEARDFKYNIKIDENFDLMEKCGISTKEAENWLLNNAGTIRVPEGSIMEEPELIQFNIPDEAPLCTFIYKLDVMVDDELYVATKLYITIKPKKNFFEKIWDDFC